MTTYPIHPAIRLKRRILGVLQADFATIDAFEGCSYAFDHQLAEVEMPSIGVQINESRCTDQTGGVWHCEVMLTFCEDRKEANDPIASASPDVRTRHEHRLEILSARLFGTYDGEKFHASLNNFSDTQGLHCEEICPPFQVRDGGSEKDFIMTQYLFKVICASTTQA